MSARSRTEPWFGTFGARLEAAEAEAREEDARREAEFVRGLGLDSIAGLVAFAERTGLDRYANNADPVTFKLMFVGAVRKARSEAIGHA